MTKKMTDNARFSKTKFNPYGRAISAFTYLAHNANTESARNHWANKAREIYTLTRP